MTDTLSAGPWGDDYRSWLTDLKQRVEHARQRAAASANRELVTLYWQIGRDILERQQRQGWGAKVIDQLARDLKDAFPDMRGFSPRNLKYMRALAQAWPAPEFVQQPAAQLPWFHLCILLDKVKDPADRDWYAGKSLEHGWSRNVLAMQIDTQAHARAGSAVTNFDACLPPPQSDLAREALKDPYVFDFLGLTEDTKSAQCRSSRRCAICRRRSRTSSPSAPGTRTSGARTVRNRPSTRRALSDGMALR